MDRNRWRKQICVCVCVCYNTVVDYESVNEHSHYRVDSVVMCLFYFMMASCLVMLGWSEIIGGYNTASTIVGTEPRK